MRLTTTAARLSAMMWLWNGVVMLLMVPFLFAEEPASVAKTSAPMHGITVTQGQDTAEYRVLWPGHRILTGTVESVTGDVVKVNTGELMPRVLSLKEAKDKGFPPLQKGQQLQIVVNDQNMVVDYHPAAQGMWHRIIRGQLAQPLPVGQEWAVIRTDEGKEEAFHVRPLARAKVGAIPINVPAVFLTDEANKIIDATFGSEEVLQRKTGEWKKSPPKAPYRRVEGTVVRSPGWIMVKTPDGKEQVFEVRPYVQEKLSKAGEGAPIVLLVDDENKVSDVARPPS
ncbi:MAG TPA: hypothetical protein VJR69_00615 [Nitrospira sp.]|nr:hypothetical protein [Nitrospira sp.]